MKKKQEKKELDKVFKSQSHLRTKGNKSVAKAIERSITLSKPKRIVEWESPTKYKIPKIANLQ